MRRQSFIPARNSLHRTAVLSLYRALVRSASKIPLPDDLPTPKSRAPIRHLIRKRFATNRPLTSFRLVYASMAAGYKFLSLFSKAHDRTSPQHAQITAHLRRETPRQRPRATPPGSKTSASAPPPTPGPFLRNVSPPGNPPHYVPAYALRSGFRNANLCVTADGMPFLRVRKPQPPALSRMVGRKVRVFQKKIMKLVEVDEDRKHDASLEDQWESLVAAQMRGEGLPPPEEGENTRSPTASYGWSVQLSRIWWEWQLEKTWQDWVARGRALNRFVEEQSGSGVAREGCKAAAWRWTGEQPNAGLLSSAPFPLIEAVEGQLGRFGAAVPRTEADPFTGKRWNALVESQRVRVLKWLAKGHVHNVGGTGRGGGFCSAKAR